jgi:hypothetical protein
LNVAVEVLDTAKLLVITLDALIVAVVEPATDKLAFFITCAIVLNVVLISANTVALVVALAVSVVSNTPLIATLALAVILAFCVIVAADDDATLPDITLLAFAVSVDTPLTLNELLVILVAFAASVVLLDIDTLGNSADNIMDSSVAIATLAFAILFAVAAMFVVADADKLRDITACALILFTVVAIPIAVLALAVLVALKDAVDTVSNNAEKFFVALAVSVVSNTPLIATLAFARTCGVILTVLVVFNVSDTNDVLMPLVDIVAAVFIAVEALAVLLAVVARVATLFIVAEAFLVAVATMVNDVEETASTSALAVIDAVPTSVA